MSQYTLATGAEFIRSGALRVNLGHRHVSVHLSDSEQNLSEVAL